MPDLTYHLPDGDYDPTFLKAIAMAVHKDKLAASELAYWFDVGRSHREIALELYKRVRPDSAKFYESESI